MRLLLDTRLLLWAAGASKRLSALTRKAIESPDNSLFFSVASIWEIDIKRRLDRPDFKVDAHLLRRGLLDNGYAELAITGEHALAVEGLPPIHKDPFDRRLVAQAPAEGMTLLTADANVALYPGPIRKV